MKVLVIHNFHRKGSASGDDQAYKSETALLEEHGIEVVRYTVSNDVFDRQGVIGKIRLTFSMLWSFKHYRAVKNLIKAEKPDIVHVHTFFPLLSPSILYAAKRGGVPVVATLHDTRFICPCATSLRGTQLCNECGDGHYLRMCKYGCFKNSRAQSFIVAVIFKYHRIRRSFYNQIDRYICLNDNQIKLLENIGFDRERIIKKYNFVPDEDANLEPITANGLPKTIDDIPNRYAVFFGRIGEEKGIRFLMKTWEELDIPLVVMGGGPLETEFRKWAEGKDHVYFLGYTEHKKCLQIVKSAEFVVFPSIWYEGCSMVEIEGMSVGKGIIATDLGFSSEAIKDGYNGYKFRLGDMDQFKEIIRRLWKDTTLCDSLGINSRAEYNTKYRPDNNYQELLDCYAKLINHPME